MKMNVSITSFIWVPMSCISMTFVSQVCGKEKANSIQFAVLGDRTGSHTPGTHEKIVDQIERLKPDFVINVGDMIEGYTDDTSQVIKQWEEYRTIMEPLTMPIYYTPGNHDIWSDVSFEIYERNFGNPYYSFDYEKLHFVILDNSRGESSSELSEEQIKWLIKDLKKHKKARRTFVFFHKPFWFESIGDNESDTLHSLFRNYGVDAVFTGHHHVYFSGKFDEILYTNVGSSGGGMEPGPSGFGYHFVLVTVEQEEITIAPIKMDGVLPWEEVTVSEMKLVSRLSLKGIDFESSVPLKEDLSIEDDKVSVKLTNLNPTSILDDTARWDIPEGWTVEPSKLPMRIMPGDSAIAVFHVEKQGKLYPLPSLSGRFPYSEGKSCEVKKSLNVARKAFCNRAESSPIVDGNISEPCWKDPVSHFFAPNGNPMMIDSVFFYFCHDDSNIFVAAHCKDSKIDSMTATVTEHDGAVYGEDCVGFFLQPDRKRRLVYQIYCNPVGSVFDQKITVNPDGDIDADREWNGMYEVKIKKGSDFWIVEMRIPLGQFNITLERGHQCGLNFRRKQKRFASAADWQVPISYDPSTYGILVMR